MRDLRKKALLESGKTTSRKARSKEHTPLSSKRNTPASSRNASRNRAGSHGGSDEERDGGMSDATSQSVDSLDSLIRDDLSVDRELGKRILGDCIEEILTRKGSTNQGRERCYKAYVDMLRAHCQLSEIEGREEELIGAFLKSIKEDTSEKETLLALTAIEVTIVTSPSDTIFESVYQPVKYAISNHESITINTAAIRTLGISTFYGGLTDVGTLEVKDWLLEIISSDGASVSAINEPSIIVAACEEWNLLTTLSDDVEAANGTYMDIFVDQLHGSNAYVKIAAGETIAHLYEKSFRFIDLDEDTLDVIESENTIKNPYDKYGLPMLYRLYDFYNDMDGLLETFNDLARNTSLSVHTISRTDRKALKAAFTDIHTSLSNPHHGPKFSTAFQKEEKEKSNGIRRPLKEDFDPLPDGKLVRDDKPYGSRLDIKIRKVGTLKIDKWWKLHRLNALKRVLKGGFVTHYEENEVIPETLPLEAK